jgi:hypothetical protein
MIKKAHIYIKGCVHVEAFCYSPQVVTVPQGGCWLGTCRRNTAGQVFPTGHNVSSLCIKLDFPSDPSRRVTCWLAWHKLLLLSGGTMTAEVQRLTSGSRRIWNWYMRWRRYVKFYTNAILAPYGTPRKDCLWFHFDAPLLPNSTSSVQCVGVNINSRHKKGERS